MSVEERRATDAVILGKLDNMINRVDERHEENKELFRAHMADDKRLFEAIEGRVRILENFQAKLIGIYTAIAAGLTALYAWFDHHGK